MGANTNGGLTDPAPHRHDTRVNASPGSTHHAARFLLVKNGLKICLLYLFIFVDK